MDSSSSKGIRSIEAQHPSLPATSPDASTTTLTVAPAALADASTVGDVIAGAFLNDPTWSWALPDPAARRHWWTHWIDGALRYRWTLKTDGFETVSVWIPPSGTELSADGEQRLRGLLQELVGSRASEVAELLRRFDQAHTRNESHYPESLGHQGRASRAWPRHGAVQGDLARIDAERMPAYLESSNPGNNHRYESLGFVPVVSFRAPGDGPVVTGMWRKSR